MGMTYNQYWYGDPLMVRAFSESHKLKQELENREAWLNGLYVFKAVSVSLENAFRDKKSNHPIAEYPSEPFNLFGEQKKEEFDEDVELALAESYMKQMVRVGKNWGKNKAVI